MRRLKLLVCHIALAALPGCTVVTFTESDGKRVTAWDFHPVGGELDLTIERKDGSRLKATRGQPSSEDIITGVVNALNPTGGLLP